MSASQEAIKGGAAGAGMAAAKVTIKPQSGPQSRFLQTKADIAIYGGAAGSGKSYALLMECLRHIGRKGFGAVVFRRTHKQISDEGGLWDTSVELYPKAGGQPYGKTQWVFPAKTKITFSHLQHEKNKTDWDGSQIALICFDELIHFSASMFWYLFSRNRTTCGIRPYIRCTCNPDSESWVADLIAWWIDQETGYPIPARSGKLRWFIRIDNETKWADSEEELKAKHPGCRPLSLTFISATLADNKILEAKDPEYRAKLMSLPHVERERLLGGNWKVRPAAGLKFPRDKWRRIPAIPAGIVKWVRFWDKAYTEGGDGSKTAGVKMGQLSDESAKSLGFKWVIAHGVSDRWGDSEREHWMRFHAEEDQRQHGYVTIGIEMEGGAGKQAAYATIGNLAGFEVYAERATTAKHRRWTPLATQQQIRNVAIVCDDSWEWADFINELDALAGDPELDKKKLMDYADAASGAFKFLAGADGSKVQGDLLVSGNSDEDEHSPLTKEELEDPSTPDFIRELFAVDDDERYNSRLDD
jgi:phage terminase large subunit-like protein